MLITVIYLAIYCSNGMATKLGTDGRAGDKIGLAWWPRALRRKYELASQAGQLGQASSPQDSIIYDSFGWRPFVWVTRRPVSLAFASFQR